MAQPQASLSINELLPNNEDALYRAIMDAISTQIRVAVPAIVQSFDAQAQTVSVQVAVQEKIRQPNLVPQWANIPILLDVPIVVPRAGGFALTLPVQAGDECLVVFGDMCIDGWWQHGGAGNVQLDKRRHDLSDAFAVLGPWSQPKVLSHYSTNSAQLRTDAGDQYVEITGTAVNLVGNVYINGVKQ